MKTIEDAATNAYSIEVLSSGCNAGVTFGKEMFKQGVEFAQRWISVDEELPKDGQRVLSAPCEHPDDCEVEMAFYKYEMFVSVHRSLKVIKADDGEICSTHYDREKLKDTTHWRPIELK